MKHFLKWLFLVSCGLTTVGCGSTQPPITSAELATADHGPYPANYQELVKADLYERAFDPTSLLLEFLGEPYKGYCHSPSVVPEGEHFGWGVVYRVNGKNRLGAYVGWKKFVSYVRNGHIIQTYPVFDELGNRGAASEWVKPISSIVPADQ